MDEVLASVVREAEADPETVAVVLHGSRAAGHERVSDTSSNRSRVSRYSIAPASSSRPESRASPP
jgi:hypothetical protein